MTGLAVRLCRVGSGDEEILCFRGLSVGEVITLSLKLSKLPCQISDGFIEKNIICL